MIDNKWIVTPHLNVYVQKFLAHLKTVKGEPIMIVGNTGVGKSMFLHIAERYYVKKLGLHKDKLRWINCAHFGGQNSDPNLARSELFGHFKDSFSGATTDKIGLVRKFEGQILVFEEIGELPRSVQSMLLTFVETGEFRRVGSTEIEKVKSKPIIVGATNRDTKLRSDFRYRFNPFYIPSLYERREDILYYWAYKFPHLLKELHGWEALTILSYNWPGNVREIDRVGKLIERENLYRQGADSINKKIKKSAPQWTEASNISRILDEVNYDTTTIKPLEIVKFVGLLAAEPNINIDKIDKILSPYGISIFVDNYSLPFSKIDLDNFKFNLNIKNIIELNEINRVEVLSRAYMGLVAFCELFNQDESGNYNLIDLSQWPENGLTDNEHIERLSEIFKKDNGFIKSLVHFTKNIYEMSKHNSRSKKLLNRINIFQMTHDGLLKLYYKTLLELYDQNISTVSKIAGKPYSTVHSIVTDQLKIRTRKRIRKKSDKNKI